MNFFKRDTWAEGTTPRLIAEIAILMVVIFTILPPLARLAHWWFAVWLGD